ncbi:MAG TPA: hypothetical protein VIY48_07720 [Candidatus Paceibacterota bacterium]
MICHTCTHRATKQTSEPSSFLLYGCRFKRLTFGLEMDWNAGKWLGSAEDKKKGKISDMPKNCEDFSK